MKKENVTDTSITLEGLKSGTKYDVYVLAYDNTERILESTIETITTEGMPTDAEIKSGAIIFSSPTWTNGKASVTISTSTNYTIQYQINSITGTWTNGTTGATEKTTVGNIANGSTVYARLTDGVNTTGYASIGISDVTAPTGSITLDKSSVSPGATITATVTATDNESGVTLANCKWIINTSNGKIGTDETKYTGGSLTSEGKASITVSSEEGTYYVHALIKDNTGNKTEITSEKLIVSTYKYTATGMVEYDAGSWTQEEINQLKSLNLYNINIEKTASSTPGLNFTFGGFTYKGDTANASYINDGTITTSRNKSVAPQSGYGTPTSDGWMVLEWGETNGTKRYVKKLVHAGAPENFVYYYNTNNDAYRAEYILSGGTRQTGYATYKPRSFDMYKDKSKTNMIDGIHAMTYSEAKAITGSENSTNDTRRKTGEFYWLASSFISFDGKDYLWSVYNNGLVNVPANVYWCWGVRPVVTLKSGVYVDTSKHNGTGLDKYVLEMN